MRDSRNGWKGHGAWDDSATSSLSLDKRALAGEEFVLLDDARHGAHGLIFYDPVEIIEANRAEDVATAFGRMQAALKAGQHVAGYFAYELGWCLEPRLLPLLARRHGDGTLLRVCAFKKTQRLEVDRHLPPPIGLPPKAFRPRQTFAQYCVLCEHALEHIAAGDIYQLNLTFPCDALLPGDPLAYYAALRRRQMAGWGAIIASKQRYLLSLSPELFFSVQSGRVITRPMKGTRPRGITPEEDLAAHAMLKASVKDRAENLMIVDLLRNDIGKITIPGTVKVPSLFDIETYPTVFQMTSTVTGMLQRGLGAIDAVKALFPCGSITGAPKIRAIEIIASLEGWERGVYTGSIGYLAPSGDGAFNVAIRTLDIDRRNSSATLGLGSAVVSDSNPKSEWDECLAKGRFLHPEGIGL